MIAEYLQAAMNRAHYELITDDEPFYGEIPELQGVWATGKSLEECRANLLDALEGWLLLSVRRGLAVPEILHAEHIVAPRAGDTHVDIDLAGR